MAGQVLTECFARLISDLIGDMNSSMRHLLVIFLLLIGILFVDEKE